MAAISCKGAATSVAVLSTRSLDRYSGGGATCRCPGSATLHLMPKTAPFLVGSQQLALIQSRRSRHVVLSAKAAAVDQWSEKPTREEAIDLAIKRLSEDDIAATAAKYKIEAQLFSEIDYAQVNAFTDTAFGGNPAAVCYLPFAGSDTWMQLVAREFNLSETAFLVKRRAKKSPRQPLIVLPEKNGEGVERLSAEEDGTTTSASASSGTPGGAADVEDDVEGKRTRMAFQKSPSPDNEFDLRWFTPTMEVDLCGHATLAAAQLVFSAGLVEEDDIKFHTRSGVLVARKVQATNEGGGSDEGSTSSSSSSSSSLSSLEASSLSARPGYGGAIELDFPLVRAEAVEADPSLAIELSRALGGREGDVEVKLVGRSGCNDLLVELQSEADVRNLRPDMSKLAEIDARGIIVTALADQSSSSEFDFVSRFFAPRAGIPEDPVTGSAHCTCGPYWAARLGKSSMTAYQCSERGGRLNVRVDETEGRVYLQGSAVMVMAGVLLNTHTFLK